jgi:integrase
MHDHEDPVKGGAVEELPSGRWRVRVRIERKLRTVGTFDTEKEARHFLKAFLADADADNIVVPGSITLQTFGTEWLDRRELSGSDQRAKVKDIGTERSLWRRHIATSKLAELAVQSVRPRDVKAFVKWLRQRKAVHTVRQGRTGVLRRETDRTISAQVQRHVLRLLRQCLDEAVSLELIVVNPAAKVRVRGGQGADVEDDWLRGPEIETLLSCDRISIRDRTAYACGLGLSLRLNDLKRIEVAHVHLDADVPGPGVRVRIEKTGKMHRVPVMPWLVPWLRAHLASLPEGTRWLFPAPDGERYEKSYDFGWAEKRERVKRKNGKASMRVTPSALHRAGVDRRIRFHDLRGTCATHLALGTWGRAWSLHEVKRMLAHSDQRVTERYVRRAMDELAEAAKQTPGGPSPVPRCSTPKSAQSSNPSESLRTLRDSNSRPSAPEAEDTGNGSASLRPTVEQSWNTSAHGTAARFLGALAAGTADASMRAALADVVLGSDLVRLAAEVRAGGPGAMQKAVRLAERLIEAGGASAMAAAWDGDGRT